MSVTFDYHGDCNTNGCRNKGIMYDAASLDGVLMPIVCGACGVDFTSRCVLKEA